MVICLTAGAALDVAMGPHSGKAMASPDWCAVCSKVSPQGYVMLADALYCNYFLITSLMGAGVDVLFERSGSRITDFRRGQSLGARDHLVRWPKPARPEWMTPEQHACPADELTAHEVMRKKQEKCHSG